MKNKTEILKKGLLLASFGTSYPEAEKKCIQSVENACAVTFDDFEVRRAFTSRMIINKIAKHGVTVLNPLEALMQMKNEGFSHVIIQPLLFIKGYEFENKISRPLKALKSYFDGFVVTDPLLSSEKDIEKTVQWVAELSVSVNGEKILFMGHGTDHSSDSVYLAIQKKIHNRNINVDMATVEGSLNFEYVLNKYKQKAVKKVHLFPFMLVAGNHVRNDMLGEEKGWKIRLENAGIEVVSHLMGLGEFMRIQDLFIDHIYAGKDRLFP